MEQHLSLAQIRSKFYNEEVCIEYLFQLKWPNGFLCPRCNHPHAYRINTRRLPLFECMNCHHQTSLTVGTVMEGSRTSLGKWMIALFLMSQISSGINATELSKIIEVTYKTAWLMLHKIRNAMCESDADVMLTGFVQINDAYYSKPQRTSQPVHPTEQPVLIGASLNQQHDLVYVKMKHVPRKHRDGNRILRTGIDEFKENSVDSSTLQTTIITGRYKSRRYKPLFPLFYAASCWIYETFRGLGPRHLNAYLNEFCYRFNVKLENKNIFDHLAKLCMNSKAISCAVLTLQGARQRSMFI